MRSHRAPLLFLMVLVTACGRNGGDGPGDEPDTTAAAIPAADTARAPLPPAVALPEAFPAEFPVPPGSTVAAASSETHGDGVLSNVTIVVPSDPGKQLEWYREALGQAGWTVTTQEPADSVRTLHAGRGESYVDLTVLPWPGDPAGATARVDAAIWTLNP